MVCAYNNNFYLTTNVKWRKFDLKGYHRRSMYNARFKSPQSPTYVFIPYQSYA